VKLERALRSITALIVESCDPEAVLLFGSYAKGLDTPDSDLDLLVVGEFRESHHPRGLEVRELMRRFPIRIDLHFVTPAEVRAAPADPQGFLSSALTSSIPLYRKGADGQGATA
jgi:predicted nucleotidyltransferase